MVNLLKLYDVLKVVTEQHWCVKSRSRQLLSRMRCVAVVILLVALLSATSAEGDVAIACK